MKRTFKLTAEGKDDARVRDKVRHEINKYVKRERRKELPEDGLRWDMRCTLGVSEATAQAVDLKALGAAIDKLAEEGNATAFVSIKAELVKRSPRPTASG